MIATRLALKIMIARTGSMIEIGKSEHVRKLGGDF